MRTLRSKLLLGNFRIGFTVFLAFWIQKSDFRMGRTVKKLEIIKKILVLYCFMCFSVTATAIPGRVAALVASRCVCVSVSVLFDAP